MGNCLKITANFVLIATLTTSIIQLCPYCGFFANDILCAHLIIQTMPDKGQLRMASLYVSEWRDWIMPATC
jgi:hypothetical protein